MKDTLRANANKILMGLGMVLAALFQTGEAQAAMIEDEGTGERHLAKKVMAGIVMKVRQKPGTNNISLKISETRVDRKGHPVCHAPTGRTLLVESVGGIYLAKPSRLKSTLIVMESPGDLTPRDLKAGDCVSIAPDDIDRVDNTLRSSIKIEETPEIAKKTDKLKDGLVTLWANIFPTKGAVAHHWRGQDRPRRMKTEHASIPAKVHPLGQPA